MEGVRVVMYLDDLRVVVDMVRRTGCNEDEHNKLERRGNHANHVEDFLSPLNPFLLVKEIAHP